MPKSKRATPSPADDWTPVFRSNYRSELLRSDAWVRKADGLIEIASGLVPRIRRYWRATKTWIRAHEAGERPPKLPTDTVCGVYLMLSAYALENLLKAYFVAVDREKLAAQFESSGGLPKRLGTHDLFKLAKAAGFQVNLQDETLLRRLFQASVWYGRYPVPKNHRDYGVRFSNGKEYGLRVFREDDPKEIADLIRRIRGYLGV